MVGALGRQPAVRRGDGAPDRRGGQRSRPAELPDTVQAVLAARLDALEPFERRLVQQAAVVGRTFWEGSLAPLAGAEGTRARAGADRRSRRRTSSRRALEGPLAGERELAFKHVLIRDVAYGMLPKAVRSRKHFEVGAFIEERAGDRTDEVVALLAEHYGRAAALGREGGAARRTSSTRCAARALRFLEEAGDAAALAVRQPRGGRALPPRPRRSARRTGAPDGVRIGEKLGDVSLRLGRVDEAIAVWLECLDWHRGQEDLERVADLHRKIGAALSHKGERKAAIEHYQKGINLLKDGPPRLELVRLYEEAAWLYLHTGDNMLAIYASEKALRLAERLGETRAASRAHGIFGRVFGRIGDTEKARQNLERAVELARARSGRTRETILALSALGPPPRDLRGRRGRRARRLRGGAGARRAGGHAARPGGAARLARPAGRLRRRLGRRSSGRPRRAPSWPSARGWWASSACRTRCAACCAGARGGSTRPPCCSTAPTSWPSRSAGRSSPSRRCSASRSRCATRATSPAPPAALDRAIDVCERAGPDRAVDPGDGGAGRGPGARAPAARRRAEAAREAVELAERLHYPIGRAAALEARGRVPPRTPPRARRCSRRPRRPGAELDRPLEAARARLLAGQVLLGHDAERARELLEQAADAERASSACRTWPSGRARSPLAASGCTRAERAALLGLVGAGDHDHAWRRPPAPGWPGRSARAG